MLEQLQFPDEIDIAESTVEQIKDQAIERTCALTVAGGLREGYADTPAELEAIEPCEVSAACTNQIKGFDEVPVRQQDRVVDELVSVINQTL